MKQSVLILILLALTGCQSTQSGGTMTVIAPQSTEDASQPELQWVKRDNVFYLQLEPATPSN